MTFETRVGPVKLAPSDVVEFLYWEARLLDDRRFEEWLDLFTDDAYVWVPAGLEAHERGTQVSLMHDDKEIREHRVRRLRHPMIHSQTPAARASRLLSNVVVEESGGTDELTVHSSFIMVESRLGESRVFGGHYEHRLRRVEGGWRIAAKTVRLVNSEVVLSNLALPF